MSAFQALDADKDGVISAAALTNAATSLKSLDRNGDGKLSRDELPERMQGLFDRADTDKNGVLTAGEIRKSAQTASAPVARSRGEGRDERPNFMRLDPILAGSAVTRSPGARSLC